MNKSTLNTRHPNFKLIEITEEQLLTPDNINRVKQLKVDIDYLFGIDKKGNLLIGNYDNLCNVSPEHITIGHLFKDDDQSIKEFYCGQETYLPSEAEFYHNHPCCPDKRKRLDERATTLIKDYYSFYKWQHRRQAAQSFRTVDDSIANLVDINYYIDYVAKNIEHLNLDDIKMGLLAVNIEYFAQQLLARNDLHSILENHPDIVCFLDTLYFGDFRCLVLYTVNKKTADSQSLKIELQSLRDNFQKQTASLQLLRNAADVRAKITNSVRKECSSYDYYLRRKYSVDTRAVVNQLIA